jgi:alkyl sulfatase BDS1-like metallo-beta-lactamase superfamily hydrolase
MAFDYVGISLDSEKAARKEIKINFVIEGTNGKRSCGDAGAQNRGLGSASSLPAGVTLRVC